MRHTERLARARTACEEDRHAGERKLERVLLLLVEAADARAGLGLFAAAARLVEGRRCVGALLAIGEQAHVVGTCAGSVSLVGCAQTSEDANQRDKYGNAARNGPRIICRVANSPSPPTRRSPYFSWQG